jgi:signal transduction histidine kinase/DNA-binding response OmpR family regulator
MTKKATQLALAHVGAPGLSAHAGGRPGIPADSAHESPINILIVDDEPANLIVLQTVLEDPGYRLVRAETPEQALLALVEDEFALLILDIRMPGMNGFELAQMIKQRKKTAGVPIIFLTAYYDKDQHESEGYGKGAVDFLNKPVNPSILRSKVAVFADLHRKSRAIAQAHDALLIEVAERRRAEERLRELTESLERRVTARTEELRRADEKLHSVMNSITDGLLMLDKNWCFTYCNAQGARMLGMRPELLIGGCVWDLLPLMRRPKFFENFYLAMDRRETVAFEEFCPDPLDIWLGCHCYPSDEGLSVYFHDITDRREVEVRREQLLAAEQAARAEGERVARAKDEFLASLSHELRTPLAAILGWSRVLQQRSPDPSTLSRGIDAISRNAWAQSNLVNDLLDMSRIVSGKLRLNLERVDLRAIADAAADTARPAAQAKGVAIRVASDGSRAEILGDTMRLQQIASNLVTNALKFTPAGGTVSIATAVNGANAVFEVSDTGQGIAADFLPYVFDRFSQADGSAARVHGGLGLGLSIVKNLVELHGGTVLARSAGDGKGATFSVAFAQAAAASETTGIHPGETAAVPGAGFGPSPRHDDDGHIDLAGVSVLLVDDDADMLAFERRLLGDCGANVTTAGSAELALQRLRSERFDVLLSDLGMPGTDGYGLIKTVRSTLGISADRLPAAAVTGFVRAEDRERALADGYQAFVQRPASPTALARTVFDLMQRAPPTIKPRPAQSTSVPRLRALFVEDNSDLQEQIGWMLEDEGLDLVTCASGEAAELEFRKGGFDVVVTDISLPNMSGIEFAQRALALAPQTWIIFSTGYPFIDRLSDIGPHVRSLLKPFDAAELHQLIDEVRAGLNRSA